MILSKVYEDAEHKLKRNEITLGEFERLVDIEVEKVVYCKECKLHNTHLCFMAFELIATDDDDYCSRGERREP